MVHPLQHPDPGSWGRLHSHAACGAHRAAEQPSVAPGKYRHLTSYSPPTLMSHAHGPRSTALPAYRTRTIHTALTARALQHPRPREFKRCYIVYIGPHPRRRRGWLAHQHRTAPKPQRPRAASQPNATIAKLFSCNAYTCTSFTVTRAHLVLSHTCDAARQRRAV